MHLYSNIKYTAMKGYLEFIYIEINIKLIIRIKLAKHLIAESCV